jgi:hypothetical protein
MKKYTLNTAAGADLTKSVGPSAEFLQMPIAFNYRLVPQRLLLGTLLTPI